jgi:hypothetical protein
MAGTARARIAPVTAAALQRAGLGQVLRMPLRIYEGASEVTKVVIARGLLDSSTMPRPAP